MKTVIYKSKAKLQCDCSCYGSSNVIICLVPELVASGASYIIGEINKIITSCVSGFPIYDHYIDYDEELLSDSSYSLIATDIKGLQCNECFEIFTAYVDANNYWYRASGRTRLKTISDKLNLTLPVYANNAAALAGGLIAGDLYRTGSNPDTICVVH